MAPTAPFIAVEDEGTGAGSGEGFPMGGPELFFEVTELFLGVVVPSWASTPISATDWTAFECARSLPPLGFRDGGDGIGGTGRGGGVEETSSRGTSLRLSGSEEKRQIRSLKPRPTYLLCL